MSSAREGAAFAFGEGLRIAPGWGGRRAVSSAGSDSPSLWKGRGLTEFG